LNALTDKKGNSSFWTAVLVLAICMIFSAVLTYASLMSAVRMARDTTQLTLDSFVIENAVGIYDSIKNGSNEVTLSQYDQAFTDRLTQEFSVVKSGSSLYNMGADGGIVYAYKGPLTHTLNGDVLELKTTFELTLPVAFAGQKVTDLRIPLEARSLYVLKL